ncbi:MAG: hypothetical protein ACKVT1_04515 [Dehalococcoidia bacterium]
MAFTVVDVEDLLRVLRENPEMRAAARREILGEELLALPDLVRQNTADIQALTRPAGPLPVPVRTLEVLSARMDGRLRRIESYFAERRCRDNFARRFGGLISRAQLLTPRDLDRFEDAAEAGAITPQAAEAVRHLDLIVAGRRGDGTDRRDVVLAVEVSLTIEQTDVERAVSRAGTLGEVGYEAIPAVAGATIETRLRASALASGVHVLLRPEDVHVPDVA